MQISRPLHLTRRAASKTPMQAQYRDAATRRLPHPQIYWSEETSARILRPEVSPWPCNVRLSIRSNCSCRSPCSARTIWLNRCQNLEHLSVRGTLSIRPFGHLGDMAAMRTGARSRRLGQDTQNTVCMMIFAIEPLIILLATSVRSLVLHSSIERRRETRCMTIGLKHQAAASCSRSSADTMRVGN